MYACGEDGLLGVYPVGVIEPDILLVVDFGEIGGFKPSCLNTRTRSSLETREVRACGSR